MIEESSGLANMTFTDRFARLKDNVTAFQSLLKSSTVTDVYDVSGDNYIAYLRPRSSKTKTSEEPSAQSAAVQDSEDPAAYIKRLEQIQEAVGVHTVDVYRRPAVEQALDVWHGIQASTQKQRMGGKPCLRMVVSSIHSKAEIEAGISKLVRAAA